MKELNKKWYLKKNNALKVVNNKNSMTIKNESDKTGFIVFLTSFKTKRRMVKIKNRIKLLKGLPPKIQILTIKKHFFAELKMNSEYFFEKTPKYSFIALKINPNSEFIIEEISCKVINEKPNYYDEFKKDILLIAPLYPSIENRYTCAFLHTRMKAYIESGLKVDLAIVNHHESYSFKYDYEGITVHNLSYNDLRTLLQNKIYPKIMVHFFSLEYAQILDATNTTKTQIYIYSHGSDTAYWDRPIFSKQYFSPSYKIGKAEKEKLYEMDDVIKRYNLMENVKFVFVSNFLKKRSEKLINIKYNNYEIIPCLIDEKKFSFKKKDKDQRKKICLIRSFHNLNSYSIDSSVKLILELSKRKVFSDLEFSIFGDGEMHEILLEPVRKFENVKICKQFLSTEEMVRMYQSHGIALFSSKYDTQGVAILEAAMSGVVPIVSFGTGLSEFLDEKLGNFFDSEDIVAQADFIERLYYNDEEFLKLSNDVYKSVFETSSRKKTIDKEIIVIKNFNLNEKLEKQKKLKEKPLLTVAIPAYNCGQFLPNTIYSLINHKYNELVEIIIINDGSKDNTGEIAKKLKKLSPSIKVIDKENGGHGSAINSGIKAATGKYFRLLDGDDYFITENFVSYLEKLKNETADIVLTNYVEDFAIDAFKNPKRIYDNLEPYQLYDLSLMNFEGYGFKGFGPLLSTATYKTKNLKSANFLIDEKCFYVDMEYNFLSYITSENLIYYPLDIYCYYLGRAGQSMSQESLTRNYLHHETVTMRIIKEYKDRESNLEDYQKKYIVERLIIPLANMQYILTLRNFKNRTPFLSYDQKLKRFPEFYKDKRIIFNSVLLHRITGGFLIGLTKGWYNFKNKLRK